MDTIRHNVPVVFQSTSPICWLACATMVLQYRRGRTLLAHELGQREGDFRFQSVPREAHAASGAQEIAELRSLGFAVTKSTDLAPNLVRAPTMAGRRERTGVPASGPSEELIHWVLSEHGPFILRHNAGAFSYGSGGVPAVSGGGHSIVVTGINPVGHTVYFNNPWGQKDVPTTSSSIVGAMQRWEGHGYPSIAYL